MIIEEKELSFDMCMTSLVCVNGKFPRGHGNYMIDMKENALVMNLSHEDYKDAIGLGIIKNKVKCKVYSHNNSKAIVVVDERLPLEALKPFWMYQTSKELVQLIIRERLNLKDNECMNERFPTLTKKYSPSGRSIADENGKRCWITKCGCCGKEYNLH